MSRPLLLTGLTLTLAAIGAIAARPTLPEQFVVSTGTTMPFADLDPVAQSGAIYFDRINGQLRIDNFWMGDQRTFLVDTTKNRAYIINNGNCVTSVVNGLLHPVHIPEGAARDRDINTVRGVTVDRYSKVIHEDDHVHVDMFLRQMNFSVFDKKEDRQVSFWVPWRVTSRRVRHQEMLPPPPAEQPNWRFFGEKVSDSIVRYGADGRAIARLVRDIPITVDFYNFVPMAPDPSIFEAPSAICGPPTETFEQDLDLFEVQRQLIELSFNNEEGRRLMRKLWKSDDGSHSLPERETKHSDL